MGFPKEARKATPQMQAKDVAEAYRIKEKALAILREHLPELDSGFLFAIETSGMQTEELPKQVPHVRFNIDVTLAYTGSPK